MTLIFEPARILSMDESHVFTIRDVKWTGLAQIQTVQIWNRLITTFIGLREGYRLGKKI